MFRILLFGLLITSFHAGAQFQGLIVNEFSQGDAGSREYIELLVVGNRTCTDSTADLRGWIVDDQNGWYWNDNGAAGHYRFKDVLNWEKVPFGAIVLLYNAASGSKNLSITLPDDPTDSNKDLTYILPINSPAYLEEHDNEPVETSGPSYQYPAASSTTGYGGATNTWIAHIALNNNGDVICLVSPANRSSAFFSINYGITIGASYQTPTVSIPNVAGGFNAYLAGAAFTNAASWVIAPVAGNETPGWPNGGGNSTWIATMRLSRPEISVSALPQAVCFSSNAQQIGLAYGAAINSPTHYSIAWDASATGLFAAITNAPLSFGSIPISVPAATPPGTYTGYLMVHNASGSSCTSDTFTITILPSPTGLLLNVVQPSCSIAGSIAFAAPVGPGFTYSLDGTNYQTPPLFSNLLPASYTVWVRNTSGCRASANVLINPFPEVPATPVLSVDQPTCTNGSGSVAVNSPLGAGLAYSIDGINYQSSPVFGSLLPGTYVVRVRNSSGCVSVTVPVQILPASGTVFHPATVCLTEGGSYNFNGQLLTTTGTYTTSFVRPGKCDSIVQLYLLVARTEKEEFKGCGRVDHNGTTYFSSVTLRDTVRSTVAGCDSLYQVTQIIVHPVPVSTVTVCVPMGQTYTFNGQVLTNSGLYSATFTASTGCDSTVHLRLTVANRQTQTLSGCGAVQINGISYMKDTILTRAVPSILTGCDSLIFQTTIIVIPKPVLVTTGSQTICKGDTVELQASAGSAAIEWVGFGSVQAIKVSPPATNTYTAIATAPSGCADTADVTITVADFDCWLTASANPVLAGSRVLLTSGGSSSYHVLSWQPAFPAPSQLSQVLTADTTQFVQIKVQAASGCVDSASLLVVVDPLNDVYIPDAFTPNGDGKNDFFVVAGGSFKSFVLKIFNRWGQTIFYATDRARAWDGKAGGREQATGSYVYVLTATLKDGRKVERKGTVTLIR